MASGISILFLGFCLYGFTIAQSSRNSWPAGNLKSSFDSLRPSTNDIQFDQDPIYLASGDGKYWHSDDEDFGVSGSGSGGGILEPDIDVQPDKLTPKPDVFSTPRPTAAVRTTTTTTTTTTTERPNTKCEIERERSKVRLTSQVPRCDPVTGEYDLLQCDGAEGTGTCWCADLEGKPIIGTFKEKPEFPDCDDGSNLPKCAWDLIHSSRSRLLGIHRSSCTDDGLYEKMQCTGGMCYCVDQNTGDQDVSSVVHLPQTPDCDEETDEDVKDVIIKPLRPDVKVPSGKSEPDIGFPEDKDDSLVIDPIDQNRDVDEDIDIDNNTDFEKPVLTDIKFDVDKNKDTTKSDDDDEKEDDDDKGREGSPEGTHGQKDRVRKASEILTQPGILAGIIGGAVVLLLCLVLLLMFVVYRMRKKDEGSYPLDEPRRGPPNYSYMRAPDKEYYA